MKKNDKTHLINFIHEKTGLIVDDQTNLFFDLGLTGLDADMFLEECVDKYQVNMTNFEYYDFFHKEPILPWVHLLTKPTTKTGISLDDLLSIIKRGQWLKK